MSFKKTNIDEINLRILMNKADINRELSNYLSNFLSIINYKDLYTLYTSLLVRYIEEKINTIENLNARLKNKSN